MSKHEKVEFEDSPAYHEILKWANSVYARKGVYISPDAVICPCRDHAAVQAWLTVPYTLKFYR